MTQPGQCTRVGAAASLQVWYSVAPGDRKKFENMAGQLFPELVRNCKAFLRHKDILISPRVLRAFNVPFQQARQEAGEFVVLNAAAYHSGFNQVRRSFQRHQPWCASCVCRTAGMTGCGPHLSSSSIRQGLFICPPWMLTGRPPSRLLVCWSIGALEHVGHAAASGRAAGGRADRRPALAARRGSTARRRSTLR